MHNGVARAPGGLALRLPGKQGSYACALYVFGVRKPTRPRPPIHV
jgi:hypothetical protein